MPPTDTHGTGSVADTARPAGYRRPGRYPSAAPAAHAMRGAADRICTTASFSRLLVGCWRSGSPSSESM